MAWLEKRKLILIEITSNLLIYISVCEELLS